MAIHASIHAWRISWTKELGGATVHGVTKSWTRLSTCENTHTHTHTHTHTPRASHYKYYSLISSVYLAFYILSLFLSSAVLT